MDDRAGGEEEQRLEEGVRDEVEDGGGVGSDAAGQEHVAELRDGGVGEHALDVGLHHADSGGEEAVAAPMISDTVRASGERSKMRMRSATTM